MLLGGKKQKGWGFHRRKSLASARRAKGWKVLAFTSVMPMTTMVMKKRKTKKTLKADHAADDDGKGSNRRKRKERNWKKRKQRGEVVVMRATCSHDHEK